MRQYLQPNQVAQVVQLLHILVHPYVPSQGSLMCLPTRSHDHWGDTWRRAITWGELDMTVERTGMEGLEAGLLSDPLCMKEQEEHCQSPPKWPPAGYWCALLTKLSETDSMRVAWEQHEGPMSCCETCAHRLAPCSLIGICQWTPELAGLPLVSRSLQGSEQVHTEHIWQTWKSL